ncbi:TlpA family protein disulfide reductase [Microcella pacifica]|jgi:thiol-disulfide isomerase/thioredoxin|uniref:TlpA family protein disulfide reductase n=1 Tax=Microcella pacifica TaxID=2591847 RepID=A0A9E5JLJ9_9MICO|nr:TlpA disulfide reductase family protein [Microcella pacifica]NHF62800.1 TlpA family protein disulfide reductase [Microcella pacifica]
MSAVASRHARRLVVTIAIAVVLTGCTANDSLAEQYRSGNGQGYISGDGAYTVIAEADRGEAIEFEGTIENGDTVSSDDYRGEVLVVNFWYAACPPCRLEAPDLEALSQQFAPDGVSFLGMNIYDQAPTAMSFAEEFGVTYPSILDANDGSVRLAFAGQVAPNAVPTTLVLDQQGRVAARISGVISEPSVLRSMITDVLAEDS